MHKTGKTYFDLNEVVGYTEAFEEKIQTGVQANQLTQCDDPVFEVKYYFNIYLRHTGKTTVEFKSMEETREAFMELNTAMQDKDSKCRYEDRHGI